MTRMFHLPLSLLLVGLAACDVNANVPVHVDDGSNTQNNDGDTASSGDADTDTDADSDTDTDTDTDSDTSEPPADNGDASGDDQPPPPPPEDTDSGFVTTTIYAVQKGDVDEGALIEIDHAVVVGDHARYGFHVMDPKGGPYSGVWVFDDGKFDVAEGDEVTIKGFVRELDGSANGTLTTIDVTDVDGAGVDVTGSAPVPSPHELTPQDLALSQTAEPWEGVLVQVHDVTVYDPDGGNGEWIIDAGVPVDNLYEDFRVHEYDTFSTLVGVVFYGGDHYKIEPRERSDYQGLTEATRDCPAQVCADDLREGDLVLTEVMADPDEGGACANEDGQWFEVYNTLTQSVSLDDVRMVDEQGDDVQLVGGVVAPKSYAVVGINSNDFCYDLPASMWAGETIDLGSVDGLQIINPKTGELVDAWTWDHATPGVSLQVDAGARLSSASNDDPNRVCDATSTIPGSTDLGTPGAANDPCPAQ